MKKTLIIIKPDAVMRGKVGELISRFEKKGLKIIGLKMEQLNEVKLNTHYEHLKEQPFFLELIKYIKGDLHEDNRVMALVYWGQEAIKKVREIAGVTNPEEANPVSIRGAYGRILTNGLFENVVHASSSESEAEREIKLWFNPAEIVINLYPSIKTEVENSEQEVWK